jgi:hypothetical protein
MSDLEMQRVPTREPREQDHVDSEPRRVEHRVSRYVHSVSSIARSARSLIIAVVIIVLVIWTLWAIAQSAISNEANKAAHDAQVSQRMDQIMKLVSALLVGVPVDGARLAAIRAHTETPIDYELRYTEPKSTTTPTPH